MGIGLRLMSSAFIPAGIIEEEMLAAPILYSLTADGNVKSSMRIVI